MSMGKNLFILLGIISFLSAGCSIQASLKKRTPDPVVVNTDYSFEFVSTSAQQVVSTPDGYKVEMTLGSPFSQIKQTSSGGDTVYTTVQGIIISE